MRYPASEKAEIIGLVEQSHLPAKRTLDKLGIPRATFYRWYDRYREGGIEALAGPSLPTGSRLESHSGRRPRPDHRLSAAGSELSPRELAVRFTDERKYFVSEASVYRLLKAHDLITSPAYVVIKAANEFKDKTTAINQLWQTDFTYLKITGWAGTIYRRCSTTSRATSWPGGSAPLCALPTSRPLWTRPWRHRASTARPSCSGRNCSATMVRRMLQRPGRLA